MVLKVFYTGSSGNFNVVSDSKTSIAIDCGVTFKKIKSCVKINTLSACLITHSHKDHCLAVEDIIKSGVDVYTSNGTKQDMITNSNSNIINLISTIKANKVLQIGTLKIIPFATMHDTTEPLGFVIQSTVDDKIMLFATDTSYIPSFPDINFNIIAIECNWDKQTLLRYCESENSVPIEVLERNVQTHYSFEKCLDYLFDCNFCNVNEIILLHCSKSRGNIEVYKKLINDIFSTKVR